MRNRYPGWCYRCGVWVPAGEGHFERMPGRVATWRVQHANCAIEHRGTAHASPPRLETKPDEPQTKGQLS